MRSSKIWSVTTVLVALLLLSAPVVAGDDDSFIDCELTFTLKGWSAFYKTASGQGTVTCSNGESAKITIKAKGGGLTVGKSEITDGHGEFSDVRNLDEIFGTYAQAEAHAGAVKSSKASVVTKGEVSLALSGTGRGWDIGVGFGKFTISRE